MACGAEFTMWICQGQLWSAGGSQHGVLGHGTDHEYNAKDCAPPARLLQAAGLVCAVLGPGAPKAVPSWRSCCAKESQQVLTSFVSSAAKWCRRLRPDQTSS